MTKMMLPKPKKQKVWTTTWTETNPLLGRFAAGKKPWDVPAYQVKRRGNWEEVIWVDLFLGLSTSGLWVKEKSPRLLSLSLQQGKWHWAFLHYYILGEKKELSVQCDEKTGFRHHHSSIPFKVIMYIPQDKREPFAPAAVAPIWFGG